MKTDKQNRSKVKASAPEKSEAHKVNPLLQNPDGSPKWSNPTTVMQRGDSYGIKYVKGVNSYGETTMKVVKVKKLRLGPSDG